MSLCFLQYSRTQRHANIWILRILIRWSLFFKPNICQHFITQFLLFWSEGLRLPLIWIFLEQTWGWKFKIPIFYMISLIVFLGSYFGGIYILQHTCRNTRISGSGPLVILRLTSPRSHYGKFDIAWKLFWHWWNFWVFWSLTLPE